MSKKYRKVLAAILAASMVLGSSMVANAAVAVEADAGKGEGKGQVDVVEKSDIFSVLLPTSAGTTFNYILDPTGVIAETKGEKYSATASFVASDSSTMYFAHKPGANVATYSNESDPITAYNLSTMEVEIKVEAKVATPSGMQMVATMTDTEKAYATPSIYLALKASESGTTTAITTAGIVATGSLASASGCYEIKYATPDKVYRKVLNTTGSDAKAASNSNYTYNGTKVFDSYSFMLTGACNPNGNWEGLTETPPAVTVVWSVAPPANASVADLACHMQWSGSTVWIGKAAAAGFSTKNVTVEVSTDKITYKPLAGKFTVSNTNWVSATYMDISSVLGGNPATIYVRVTDGATKYVVKVK